jgi:hypothetical protein
MLQSSLLTLARCLHKSEWRALHDFAASPLQNTRSDVKDLLRYMEQYLPKRKDAHFMKEKVWEKIYETKPYDDTTMRYLMFLTQQLIQQFISFKHWEKDEIGLQIGFLQALRKRTIEPKFFDSEIRKTKQLIEKQSLKNYNFYYNDYLFQIERYEYGIAQQREATEGFQAFSDALNIFFMAQKLRQGCAALVQNALSKSNIKIDFLEEVLQFVAQKNGLPEVPLVAMLFYIYRALSDNQDDTYFDKLKSLLFQVDTQFTHSELRELYLYAINCCIRRINAAKSNYISEVFDIYQKGLESKALLENGMLSRYTYNNIVMAGVRLQEFDWTEKFMLEYKPFLEKFRENTANHAFATFYFKKKDYAKAMIYLQQSDFDDVLHNLDARRMLACIYYDLNEFNTLDAHLEAFKNYLYRHKNLGYHRENCLGFIRLLWRLIALNFSNPLEIKALADEINATSQLVG